MGSVLGIQSEAAGASPEQPQAVWPDYRLHSFEDFRRYIIDADIKLVRPQYLRHLHDQGRLWPRRQEAEEEPDALHAPTENETFSVVTISHVWESMEHPDPCGFQLAQIVRQMDLQTLILKGLGITNSYHYNFEDNTSVYFFIDFISLYQYKREHQGQEDAFRKSLACMHLFYANSNCRKFCHVWRIESLTPERMWFWHMWRANTVHIYLESESSMQHVPLKALKRNETAYSSRGWCKAEAEWSKPCSTDISGISSSALLLLWAPRCCTSFLCLLYPILRFSQPGGELPLRPEEFRQIVELLRFTHRSDLGPVLELQRQVFEEKMLAENVDLVNPSPSETYRLLEMIPLYRNLREFQLTRVHLEPSTVQELLRILAGKATLRVLSFSWVPVTMAGARVVAECLGRGEPPLQQLDLHNCGLSPASVTILAEALAANVTLRELHLGATSVRDAGAAALAAALRTNCTLQRLDVSHGGIGTAGAVALAASLEANEMLRKLDLHYNPVGPRGLRAIAAAQEHREDLVIEHERLDLVPDADGKCTAERCLHWCRYSCVVCCFALVRLVLLAFTWLLWLRFHISGRFRSRQESQPGSSTDLDVPLLRPSDSSSP